MTYGPRTLGPIVPPAREGHRRKFSEPNKRQIVEETAKLGASVLEVARRYGIAARVLFHWKQELTATVVPAFVAVQFTDASVCSDATRSAPQNTAPCRHEDRLAQSRLIQKRYSQDGLFPSI